MIDFWEALGRLAYDQELFNKFQEVLGQPPASGYLPMKDLMTEKKLPADGKTASPSTLRITATVLEIPREDYEKVQNFLRPILTEHYVSLFVAGELIWTFSRQDIRAAFTGLHDPISSVRLHAPSTSYFINLGLLLVDKLFREKVTEIAKADNDLAPLLPRLSDLERYHLKTVLRQARGSNRGRVLRVLRSQRLTTDLRDRSLTAVVLS